jgi:ketosteroid isomerase-like protein
MASASNDYGNANRVFNLQIQSIINDDRVTQMSLYSEDLHYEFPFANDRPKLIKGRDAFKNVMEPIWERRRKNNIALSVDKLEFHATDEVGLYLATFVLIATDGKNKEPISSLCVQLLRIQNGQIVEVREFFKP